MANKFPINERLLNFSRMASGVLSIGPRGLPNTVPAADTECPLNGVSVDHAAESEYPAGLGAEYDMTRVDRALQAARLVRSLEMAGDGGSILLELDILVAVLPSSLFE